MSNSFICLDCGVDTNQINEYYMVLDTVWRAAGMYAGIDPEPDDQGQHGMLCIGCLEKRLGRTLSKPDFTTALINTVPFFARSERLTNRLNESNSSKGSQTVS